MRTTGMRCVTEMLTVPSMVLEHSAFFTNALCSNICSISRALTALSGLPMGSSLESLRRFFTSAVVMKPLVASSWM